MALMLVAIAAAIVGVTATWGARRGTLRESEQESFDRRFLDIVIAEHLRFYGPPSSHR